MLRPAGKANEIAKRVLANKGVKVPKPNANVRDKKPGQFLQH